MKTAPPPPDSLIRACNLGIGDIIEKSNTTYKVVKILNGKFILYHYSVESRKRVSNSDIEIGVNSQEKVILIKS